MAGALLTMVATAFPILLAGRVMASPPRAVTLALVRDQYTGRAMARVMSFVMTVFIVPMIAPTMGQGVLLVAERKELHGSLASATIISNS